MSRAVMGKMARLVANSAAFRTAAGAADVDAALAGSIFLDTAPASRLPRDGGGVLNAWWCLISSVDQPMNAPSVAGGGAEVRLRNGTYLVQFAGPRQGEDDEADLETFSETLDAIYDELLALSGTDDFIRLRDLEKREGPFIEPEEAKSLGPYCHQTLNAPWGWD